MYNHTISKKTHIFLILKMTGRLSVSTLWKVKHLKDIESKTISEIIAELPKSRTPINDKLIAYATEEADRQISAAYIAGDRIISLMDKEFPKIIKRDTGKDMALLYCHGDLSLLQNHVVGITGSTIPTEESVKNVSKYIASLSLSNKTVVSGLGEGTEILVHENVLEQKGKPIIVASTGLDKAYIGVNRGLMDGIKKEGLVITALPYGTPITYKNKVIAHRLQALLARSLILTQSSVNGDALVITMMTLALNRPVYVVLPSVNEIRTNKEKCFGNITLLRKNVHEIKTLLSCDDVDVNLIKAL